jgi:hypothetical protein
LRERTQDVTDALSGIDIVESSESEGTSDILLFAKADISKKELYTKTIITLADLDVLPEKIEFKSFSLEQIYMGVINNQHLPERRFS